MTQARRRLIQMHFESGVGHIGGNLSCLDLLVLLFHDFIYEQDRFVLSKGHSAGALYIALWATGRLDDAALRTFHKDGTLLAGHPVAGWHPDILFATGSLGHGLSLANGIAHAKKIKGEPGTVFCLVSDGELNEGSTWEALHYAAHHHLDGLTVIIDKNGLQGFGATNEVTRMDDLPGRLRRCGLTVVEIDGHSAASLGSAFAPTGGGPRVIVAATRKGKGISFMENKMAWHYLPLSADLYAQAMAELEQAESLGGENPLRPTPVDVPLHAEKRS